MGSVLRFWRNFSSCDNTSIHIFVKLPVEAVTFKVHKQTILVLYNYIINHAGCQFISDSYTGAASDVVRVHDIINNLCTFIIIFKTRPRT